MKKSALILSGILAASLVVPVAAGVVQKGTPDASKLPEGTLIYEENFDGFTETNVDKALTKLGWSKVETLTKFTAKYTVENGKLIIKNNTADSQDSYALMMNDDYLKNVCNKDYTYEYQVTYKAAGNTSRYVSLLCNYDGKDNYNTVDMRVRGDGYNQTRRGSSWIHYNNTTCPIRATDKTSYVTQKFGETFNTNGMHLIDKTITIRVETSIEKGPTVYVDNIMVSDMQANKDKWQTIDHYAMVFKASKLIDAEIDNIKVWTGLADKPLEVKKEEPKASASTADLTSVLALAAAASAGAAFVAAKKRK